MSSKIQLAFQKARQSKKSAFIPFITGGFPDSDCFADLLKTLDNSGADIIEIGIPFSDPLADGPVIQHSSKLALDMGVTPLSVFETLKTVKDGIKAPLVIMSYWNPVMRFGPSEFAAALREAGVSGAIIPDLTPEESGAWKEAAKANCIDTIYMVAPTTPEDRVKKIASYSSGFLYLVSMTGVTGSSLDLSKKLSDQINSVKSQTDLPVAVGFGVSTPGQAAELSKYADGVIVGSALVKRSLEAKSNEDALSSVAQLSSEISSALLIQN